MKKSVKKWALICNAVLALATFGAIFVIINSYFICNDFSWVFPITVYLVLSLIILLFAVVISFFSTKIAMRKNSLYPLVFILIPIVIFALIIIFKENVYDFFYLICAPIGPGVVPENLSDV